jgi:hypothetical protein
MSEDRYQYYNQFDKEIAAKKSDRVVDVAKASKDKLCNCAGSEPGKVKIDTDKHVQGCRFRKLSNQYAARTSVIPNKIVDGFSLGVAIGSEDF